MASLLTTAPTAAVSSEAPTADDLAARQVILDWNGIAGNATANVAKLFQNESFVSMAYTQTAVYDAVTAISDGYQQPGTHLHAPADASVAAAAATAAHDTLVAYLPARARRRLLRPAQQPSFDAAHATTMATPRHEDGNPLTTADPAWHPLLVTPKHPEYVAAHGCLTAAEADVFTEVLGTSQINVSLDSTVTGTTRTYAMARDVKTSIVNARVWGGLHDRTPAERGVHFGDSVAAYDLSRAFGTLG